MKNAIKLAIEGGWNPEKYRQIWQYNPNNRVGVTDSYRAGLTHWDITSDPLFWQALGKTMGWGKRIIIERQDIETKDGRVVRSDTDAEMVPEWKFYWHRFIDHLAEGKDAESFFNQLLK